MKNLKILKKLDMRMLQGLVMVLLAVFFIYLFYHFYEQYSNYQEAKQPRNRGPVKAEIISAPQFHNFSPDRNQPLRYQLFWFKEKRESEKAKTTAQKKQQINQYNNPNQYHVLGVIKKDKLFLVVRFVRDNKIKLYPQGSSIYEGNRIKSLTTRQAIIADENGAEQVHKIFQVEPTTIFEQRKVHEKKKKN
jgi:hypothetical protein